MRVFSTRKVLKNAGIKSVAPERTKVRAPGKGYFFLVIAAATCRAIHGAIAANPMAAKNKSAATNQIGSARVRCQKSVSSPLLSITGAHSQNGLSFI